MEITSGKIRMASFMYKLEIMETLLEVGFIFTQAWNKDKLCLKSVSFLHKLEMKTNYAWKLGENGHAPSMVTQFKVHAAQASIHMKGRWSEGSNYDIKRKTQLEFYKIVSKTQIEQERVSLF